MPAPSSAQPVLGTRSAAVAAARRLRRSQQRRAQRRFLVEGAQAVGAALAAGGGGLVELFVGAGSWDRVAGLVERAEVPVRVVTDAAVASLSETVTPQGLVGVAELPGHRLSDMVRPRLVAVCVDTNDPGNAGTIIRTADAAGADAVVFAGSSVDPFGGKCVRASAGSVFHLPVIVVPGTAPRTDVSTDVSADAGIEAEPVAVLGRLRARGCQVLATSSTGRVDLDTVESTGTLVEPTVWLFGNEAHGLPTDWEVSADAVVRVPVYGQAESLNLAVASALCLYASARAQRTARSGALSAGGGVRR